MLSKFNKIDTKNLFLLVMLCCATTHIVAQIKPSQNHVGTNYSIASEALKEARQIQVFLPDGYEKTAADFPVLYLLDGQRLFPFGVSLLQSFTQFQQTPGFIVVGITNKYPDRFGHFSAKDNKFLTFLEKEVVPFVDANFKTSKERLLFGWEYGGSFAMQVLIEKPNLFDTYIASSPYPITDKLTELSEAVSQNSHVHKTLHFSVSPNESQVIIGTEKLAQMFTEKAPKTLQWTYKILENEEHRSTPYSTLYWSIKNYYEIYPELQFNTLLEFENAGGLDHVYAYYQKRASKYGFSKDLTDWTMFSLTRTAIRANDYKTFVTLVRAFEKTNFLSRLSVHRFSSIAEFYAKNKNYEKAITLFKQLAENHSKSERPLKGLVDCYNALENTKMSSFYLSKIKEL